MPLGHRRPVNTKHASSNESSHETRRDERAADTERRLESSGPEGPTDLSRRSWTYVLRKTVREFSKDECTDLAAALTYYAVLAMFPAAIAMLSLVGLVGQGQTTVTTLLDILRQVGASGVAKTLGPTLNQLAASQHAAGFAFVIGLLAALWSASGYVGAFGRAMNRMYEVREGRPIWKLRPIQIVVTVVALVLAAAVVIAFALTGSVAQAVGNAIGLGSTAITVWNIAKWPVMLLVVIVIVAILYWATPNVSQPKFRWLSVGAVVAIVSWIVASALFGFYVANFSSYNKTYGALAGVIVFLLWLWITNLALLFGAELDAELERGRQLQAGIEAEKSIQLPPRDTRNIEKADEKAEEDELRGRRLREAHSSSREDDGGSRG